MSQACFLAHDELGGLHGLLLLSVVVASCHGLARAAVLVSLALRTFLLVIQLLLIAVSDQNLVSRLGLLVLELLHVGPHLVGRAVEVVRVEVALEVGLEVALGGRLVDIVAVAFPGGESLLLNVFFPRAEVVRDEGHVVHSRSGAELPVRAHLASSDNNPLSLLIAGPFLELVPC